MRSWVVGSCVFVLLLYFFPAEYRTVAACRVRSVEVHGVWASCCWTLTNVAVVAYGVEHEVLVEVVLPEEYFGFIRVVGETYVAWYSFAIYLDVLAVEAFECHHAIAAVYELELCALVLVVGVCVIE